MTGSRVFSVYARSGQTAAGRDAVGWAGDSRRPLVVQTLQRAAVAKR